MSLLQSQPASYLRRPSTSRTVGNGGRTLFLVSLLTLLLFGALGVRLGYLQLVEGERNQQLAQDNRIRLIPKRPERGKILDRKGRILAHSRFSYSVFVWPTVLRQPEWPQIRAIVAELLNMPEDEIQNRLEQAGEHSPTLVRIAQAVPFEQVVALSERSYELPGVEIDQEAVRAYPHGELAAQVLGYIGEISAEELDRREEEGYRLGDIVGQMGIEASYEDQLRGTWGGQQVEVDGAGRIVQVLGEKPSLVGKNVTLSLDLEVQRAAEAALGNRQGAIVALDPRNGEVLAMASRPGFDPNWFARRVTEAEWQQLQGRQFPFVNRALQGFPPASTFKVVTAIAGLESGIFAPDAILMTYPSIHGVGDWNNAGFGAIGFVTAMQWSSNTFFGQIGVRTGPTLFLEWARKLGLGAPTGLDIRGEAAGFLPDPEWKQDVFGDSWYPADSVMVSIGQGAVQVSPLQAAVVYAAVANGGYRIKPHLLRAATEEPDWQPEPLNLKPSTLNVIRNGLRAVVTSGTGQALNVPSIPPAAGKSGTGEDPPRRSHTWFGAYAPYGNPEIVVVAFGENTGGGGGSVAGPITVASLSVRGTCLHPPTQHTVDGPAQASAR